MIETGMGIPNASMVGGGEMGRLQYVRALQRSTFTPIRFSTAETCPLDSETESA